MYNTSDQHVEHLCKLQDEVNHNSKIFYERIKRFKKGFKKVVKLSTNLLLKSNNRADGYHPYTFGCLD